MDKRADGILRVSAESKILGSVELLSSESLSSEDPHEVRKRVRERADQALRELLKYSEMDSDFAKSLCMSVAIKYGHDDKLGNLMLSSIRIDRTGSPRKTPRKWSDARYQVLLEHYHWACKIWGRNQALVKLAEMEGLSGDNAAKKIEDRITKARKKFSEEEIAEFMAPHYSATEGSKVPPAE